ncbi:LLM class flavin-dependent oxidoreductase [Cellulomonas sp. HZM]|uniref:LLM class flavin-dependent oxidoreductase n=1 Tax=Cellulomonas sp. HZM TaxID=1454010 RepID=UPI0004939E48|nr:LLM class flavin-dependent oxidoreductase [Cellulomonas sp. HZM]
MPALSVLDLIPVRTDQTTGDALAATLALARSADELGFERYWVAEHHNMPAVASTNPPVLMAMIAAATARIRVGSGGVMLPNHSPLVVAEQVALLEAAHPGRIDVGLGRAPGSDPVTSHLLRRGSSSDGVDTFPDDIATLRAMLRPDGVSVAVGQRTYDLHATPRAVGTPLVWLLGSSMYSAQLAGELGLPYVFAHHFAGRGTDEALALYRRSFVASDELARPRTIAVANVVVAETDDEARALALPNARSMWRLRSGQPLAAQELVEDALSSPVGPADEPALEELTSSWIVGDPTGAARDAVRLLERLGADELMVSPVAGTRAGSPADRSPGREQTLRLLADALR